MENGFKHEDILNLIKEARKIIGHIVEHPNQLKSVGLALLFITILQKLQEVTTELVEVSDKKVVQDHLKTIDAAISKLEEDADNITAILCGGAPFNPNNRGEA